jgi:prepilin-type N-terminal cleavage/methylation domain-containing protein
MENRKGFTLIETLIVVVIIILLSVVAVPSFKHLIASDRLQEVAWQMVQDLRTVKEDAILYQQDLRVYFCHDPPKDRNFYLFEMFQKDPLHNAHYNPGDIPDGKHFIKRELKYNLTFDSHGPFSEYGYVNGKEYYCLTFYCGKDSHFRGQPSGFDTITIKDNISGMEFYIVVDSAGRIRMNGTHP